MAAVWQGQDQQGCSNCASLFADPKQNKCLVGKAKTPTFNAHVTYRTTRSSLRQAASLGCPLCFELLSLEESHNEPLSTIIWPFLRRTMARMSSSNKDECRFEVRMLNQMRDQSSRSRTASKVMQTPAFLVAVHELFRISKNSRHGGRPRKIEREYLRGRSRGRSRSRQHASDKAKGANQPLSDVMFDITSSNAKSTSLRVEVAAVHVNSASRLFGDRPINLNVESNRSYDFIRRCIERCNREHRHCYKPTGASLPTRVLDLSEKRVRLYETNGDEEPYFALRYAITHQETGARLNLINSYCWGDQSSIITTTRRNIDVHKKDIGEANLPRTIRDAIKITRQLGFRYLWVDSLCIVQDDVIDKVEEMLRMGYIYKNAYLTISAASARDAREGFLHVREDETKALRIPFSYADMDGGAEVIISFPKYQRPRLAEPINERAWTLQEGLLSSRILIYSGAQLFWRCESKFESDGGRMTWLEYTKRSGLSTVRPGQIWRMRSHPDKTQAATRPEIIETVHSSEKKGFVQTQLRSTPKVPSADKRAKRMERAIKEPYWRQWHEIISDYSRRKLSVPEDKLLALSNIAECYHHSLETTYVAGLWEAFLAEDLTWFATSPLTIRPTTWRSPSWSPMSIDLEEGSIRFLAHEHANQGHRFMVTSTVLGFTATPVIRRARFGSLREASLTLSVRMMIDIPLRLVQRNGKLVLPVVNGSNGPATLKSFVDSLQLGKMHYSANPPLLKVFFDAPTDNPCSPTTCPDGCTNTRKHQRESIQLLELARFLGQGWIFTDWAASIRHETRWWMPKHGEPGTRKRTELNSLVWGLVVAPLSCGVEMQRIGYFIGNFEAMKSLEACEKRTVVLL